MKTLKFSGPLVPLILFGEKTSTWRLFDDKDLKKGDKLQFIDGENGDEFATAIIESLLEKKLGKITEADYDGHEKFKNQKEMLKTYKSYYGDKVTLDTPVKIIKFKLL